MTRGGHLKEWVLNLELYFPLAKIKYQRSTPGLLILPYIEYLAKPMNSFLPISIYIMLVVSSSLAAQTAREQTKFEWINKDTKNATEAQHHTLYSDANDAEVGFYIYLPEHYEHNPKSRYPVIYSLHGGGGDESRNLRRIEGLKKAIQNKLIPPTIMVLPNGAKGSGYQDSFDGSLMIKTMIIKELIPHIDQKFRTIPESRARAIQGFSMGGAGATQLGFLHPNMFSSITNFASGGILKVDFDPTSEEARKTIPYFGNKYKMMGNDPQYWKDNLGYSIVEKNHELIRRNLGIRIVFGKKDKGLEGAQNLSRFLVSLNIEHDFILHEGGHSWGEEVHALDSYAFHNRHFTLSADELKLLK